MKAKEIGRRVRHLRLKRHLTAYELAKRAGMNRSTLHSIETGRHDSVRVSTLIKIAKGLDVTLEDLVRRRRAAV